MCDLNQLTMAIQQMGNDPEATQFVNQVFQADNFQFLKMVTQIILTPDIPSRILTNSVTLISIVLRPSLSRPLILIAENINSFSEEERNQIKQAIIFGLTHEDHNTRLGFAYCLGFIVEIDKLFDKMNSTSSYMRPTIFEEYLMGLLQDQEHPYAPIGSIMAISQILENMSINPKIRKNKNLGTIILEVGYNVLAKTEMSNIVIEFKIECARCIENALKIGLLDYVLARIEDKTVFLQNIIPNTQIANVHLHKHLICALSHFLIFFYKSYLYNTLEETIIPYIEQIFQNTIQPVTAIKNEDFNLEATEQYARHIIEMWEDFSVFEKQNPSSKICITAMIAASIDELLFSYISTLPIENLLENNPESTISFFSFQCLVKFSEVCPSIIYDHALQIYNTSIQAGNRQSTFVAFVAAQIIFQIMNIPDEILFKIILDIIKFTSFDDPSIVMASYAAIISACKCHPHISKDESFFNILIQSISHTLQFGIIKLAQRATSAFQALIQPFDLNDYDSNLSRCYAFVMPMLMNATQRPDFSNDLEMEHSLYLLISTYISKLPKSVSVSEMVKFGLQIHEQMEKLMTERPDGGLQSRAWLSIIVFGIVSKLQIDFSDLALSFLNILVSTCEEANSTNTNINSHEDVLATIGAIISNTDKVSEPLIPRILDLAINCIFTQNSTFINNGTQIIYYIYKNFKDIFFDAVPNVLNILLDCLFNQTNNDVTIFFLLRSITSILNIGYDGATEMTNPQLNIMVGNILLPKRTELMNMAVGLIPNISSYKLNSEDNANCIFFGLIELFTSLMRIYQNEKTIDLNVDSTKTFPPEFFVPYIDSLTNVIEVGNQLNLWNNSIGFSFLKYLDMIIDTFQAAYHMNVRTRKPGFRNYLKKCLEGNLPLRQKASIVKDKYIKS